MQRVCGFVLSLLLVLAASGLVEGRLLAKATAASKAKEDGDAGGEATVGETADGEEEEEEDATEAAGSDKKEEEDATEAAGSDQEATEDAGGEEEGGEEGGREEGGEEDDGEEDDGEDGEEDDSPVSFVQADAEAETEADAEMDEEMDEQTEFLQNVDVNKDGKISLEELHQLADRDAADLEKHLSGEEDAELLAVSKRGIQVRKAGMASFLAIADHDKDGLVNAKEVPTLLKAIDEADAKEEETEEDKEVAEEEHKNEEEDKEDTEAEEKEEKEEESAMDDGEKKTMA